MQNKPHPVAAARMAGRRSVVTRGLAAVLVGSVAGVATAGARAQTTARDARAWPLRSPEGLRANLVTLSPARFGDRDALAVELTAEAQQALLAPGARGNGPSFAMPDVTLADGVIEVDLAARINGRGQPEVRGFVGLAFHIADDLSSFEAIYLRMTNGSRNTPPVPAPRNVRAMQYIAYPDRYWARLRAQHPGRYETAAPVAIESWHRIRLEISGATVHAFIDGERILTVDDLSYPGRAGRIGLWVDDGTTGYFSRLTTASAV